MHINFWTPAPTNCCPGRSINNHAIDGFSLIGVDGTLHALKGDKMLSVQFTTSSAGLDAAAKLVSVALARL